MHPRHGAADFWEPFSDTEPPRVELFSFFGRFGAMPKNMCFRSVKNYPKMWKNDPKVAGRTMEHIHIAVLSAVLAGSCVIWSVAVLCLTLHILSTCSNTLLCYVFYFYIPFISCYISLAASFLYIYKYIYTCIYIEREREGERERERERIYIYMYMYIYAVCSFVSRFQANGNIQNV